MKKTVVITGVTGAIGGAAARNIAKKETILVMLGRDAQKLETISQSIKNDTGNKDVSFVAADLSSVSSVRKAAALIREKHEKIDALVNVAAVYKKSRALSPEGNELMFSTNHLGPFTLTAALLPQLKKSGAGRVITVTASSTVRPDFFDLNAEKKFSGVMQFGMTKMCNLLFAFKLARELEDSGVSSAAFFPGLVKSGLMRELPWIFEKLFKLVASTPDKAGFALGELALNENFNWINGKYLDKNLITIKAPPYAYDIDAQDALWEATQKLTS